jgi:hypothetical protein
MYTCNMRGPERVDRLASRVSENETRGLGGLRPGHKLLRQASQPYAGRRGQKLRARAVRRMQPCPAVQDKLDMQKGSRTVGLSDSLGLTESPHRPQQERLGNSQPEGLRRLMLKASSNPTGCSIGWSPALAPLKIRSTWLAERRTPAPVVIRSGHERYRSYFMRPLRAPTCFCRSLSWLAS